MRSSRIACVLVSAGLLAAVCGCGSPKSGTATTSTPSTPATTSSYTLIQEPQAGYQPIYRFIAAARKTLDMTIYSLSDPKAEAALVAAAKRGVAVRVLFDSDAAGGGGGRPVNRAAYNDLKVTTPRCVTTWSSPTTPPPFPESKLRSTPISPTPAFLPRRV